MNKKCSKCGEIKPLKDFYKSRGLRRADCKACCAKRSFVWRAKNKEHVREISRKWRKENPGLLKKSRERNRPRIIAAGKKRYTENREKIKAKVAAYREKNKEKIRKRTAEKCKTEAYRSYHREYSATRRKENNEWAAKYRETHRELCNKRISDYRKTPEGKFTGKKKHYRKKITPTAILPINSRRMELTYPEGESVLEVYGRVCASCGSTEDITIDHVVPLVKGGLHIKSNVQPLCRRCNSKKGRKEIRYIPLPKEVDNVHA